MREPGRERREEGEGVRLDRVEGAVHGGQVGCEVVVEGVGLDGVVWIVERGLVGSFRWIDR